MEQSHSPNAQSVPRQTPKHQSQQAALCSSCISHPAAVHHCTPFLQISARAAVCSHHSASQGKEITAPIDTDACSTQGPNAPPVRFGEMNRYPQWVRALVSGTQAGSRGPKTFLFLHAELPHQHLTPHCSSRGPRSGSWQGRHHGYNSRSASLSSPSPGLCRYPLPQATYPVLCNPNPTTHADESRASACNASHSCSSLGAVLHHPQGPKHTMPTEHLHMQTKEEVIHGSVLESPKNTEQGDLPWSAPKQAQGGFQIGVSHMSAHCYPERYTRPRAAARKPVLSLWKHQPGRSICPSIHGLKAWVGTQEQEKTCWKETSCAASPRELEKILRT